MEIENKDESIKKIFKKKKEKTKQKNEIDLVNKKINCKGVIKEKLKIDPYRKNCLIEGLDEIGYSLKYDEDILIYENKVKQLRPWIINE